MNKIIIPQVNCDQFISNLQKLGYKNIELFPAKGDVLSVEVQYDD